MVDSLSVCALIFNRLTTLGIDLRFLKIDLQHNMSPPGIFHYLKGKHQNSYVLVDKLSCQK